MSAPKKAQLLKEAREQGRERALEWLQGDASERQKKTLMEWRALGYADVVMVFEFGPYFMERLGEWEAGFDAVARNAAGVDDAAIATAPRQAGESAPAPALALATANSAYDAAHLGRECVDELRAVLRAVVGLSERDPVVRDLAMVGFRLAETQHNLLDCACEESAANLAKAREASHV